MKIFVPVAGLMLSAILMITMITGRPAVSSDAGGPALVEKETNMPEKITRSPDEWHRRLTPEQYAITREGGTEPPFTGEYVHFKKKGVYRCVCCGNPLFDSGEKFDSGTGWPSFRAPVSEDHITTREDNRLFIKRVEVLCSRCGAHLGHVFTDGPPPGGLRYCINSVALAFGGGGKTETATFALG